MTFKFKRIRHDRTEWRELLAGPPMRVPDYAWFGILKLIRPKDPDDGVATQCLVHDKDSKDVLTTVSLGYDSLMIIFEEIKYLAYIRAHILYQYEYYLYIREVLGEQDYPDW